MNGLVMPQIDDEPPFIYEPDDIDVVLHDLRSTIHYFVRSDDTQKLERIITEELRGGAR
jgi:hypothetical protein